MLPLQQTSAGPIIQTDKRTITNGRVLEHKKLCREHYLIRLSVDSFPLCSPGQFVQLGLDVGVDVNVSDVEHEWSAGVVLDCHAEFEKKMPLLRRPFSIAGREDASDGTVILDFIYRVVGALTGELERLQAGSTLSVLGPLGRGFPEFEPKQIVLLVGGGVGIPPMIYLASELAKSRLGCSSAQTSVRAVAFAGATTHDLLSLSITHDAPKPGPASIDPLYNVSEFSKSGVPAVISTDDGSYGYKGYVTDALDAYLSRYFNDSMEPGSIRPVVCVCGPEVMMKKVADICLKRGLICYAAAERAMACGLGTCQSCVIRVKNPTSQSGWRYALTCTEGPVFDTRELLW